MTPTKPDLTRDTQSRPPVHDEIVRLVLPRGADSMESVVVLHAQGAANHTVGGRFLLLDLNALAHLGHDNIDQRPILLPRLNPPYLSFHLIHLISLPLTLLCSRSPLAFMPLSMMPADSSPVPPGTLFLPEKETHFPKHPP